MPEKKHLPSKRKRREPPNRQPSPATTDPAHAGGLLCRAGPAVGPPRLPAAVRQQYRNTRPASSPAIRRGTAGLGGRESAGWATVISQNTTEANSNKAFACLKSTFTSWKDFLAAETKTVENAIRCGGLAPTKAACIKNVLRCLMEKRGELCLEYLRELSVGEIKAELSNFKVIGPKTDDVPVNMYVFEIVKTIGWVPMAADRLKTYLHLTRRIPRELKFDLNCLIYIHGEALQLYQLKSSIHCVCQFRSSTWYRTRPNYWRSRVLICSCHLSSCGWPTMFQTIESDELGLWLEKTFFWSGLGLPVIAK
ncbi:hypothetical protein MLD38_032742 [Melastoma candidum]|uniref:Uncharacterized protein n=1 Tax=Melastoma candidum TaxID=119954 RepID=A0ACB9M6S0_9MYRT|nr:hypothetical protein MLD38_032742 [Melastoma candidum]